MLTDKNLQMRNELKYPLGRGEYTAIKTRCERIMQRDPHADAQGRYHIESLYLDDLDDTALMANYSGISRREKFRIRRYNGNNATLHLEKKIKDGGLGTKVACPLSEEEVRRIQAGELDWMKAEERPLLRELYARMRTEGLRPRTLVCYTREPFVYGPGNVRVTFDYDIRSGVCATDLLNPPVLVPAQPGLVLMEVKWDAFLPDIIRDILQEGTLRVQAFSKYASCRQYDI